MFWLQQVVSAEKIKEIAQQSPMQEWLSGEELRCFQRFGDQQAAMAWLGGRWCVKQLVSAQQGIDRTQLSRIHVESRNGREQGVRPWVFLDGQLLSATVSIAHSTQLSTAVLLTEAAATVGIDITDIEPDNKGLSYVRDFWFSKEEIVWSESGITPQVIWSLKEAIYKATNQGESFQPRRLDVSHWFSKEDCLQIDCLSGTLQSSQQKATLAWRTIHDSLIIVAAIHKANQPKLNRQTRQADFALMA